MHSSFKISQSISERNKQEAGRKLFKLPEYLDAGVMQKLPITKISAVDNRIK